MRTGTNYAIGPGSLRTGSGSPFQVFTPFSRAWRDHGWPRPATSPGDARFVADAGDGVDGPHWPAEPDLGDLALPEAGEEAAARRWQEFLDERLDAYAEDRDRPDHHGTSQLSAPLKWGELHPRTILEDLSSERSAGAETFRTEFAWREF